VTMALDNAVTEVVDFISGKCISDLWNPKTLTWCCGFHTWREPECIQQTQDTRFEYTDGCIMFSGGISHTLFHIFVTPCVYNSWRLLGSILLDFVELLAKCAV
jgi:hypothetical protein